VQCKRPEKKGGRGGGWRKERAVKWHNSHSLSTEEPYLPALMQSCLSTAAVVNRWMGAALEVACTHCALAFAAALPQQSTSVRPFLCRRWEPREGMQQLGVEAKSLPGSASAFLRGACLLTCLIREEGKARQPAIGLGGCRPCLRACLLESTTHHSLMGIIGMSRLQRHRFNLYILLHRAAVVCHLPAVYGMELQTTAKPVYRRATCGLHWHRWREGKE